MSEHRILLVEILEFDFKFTINSVMRFQYGSDEELLSTKYVFNCDEMEQLVKVWSEYSEFLFISPVPICSVLDRICSCQTLTSQYFTKKEQNKRRRRKEKKTPLRNLSFSNTREKPIGKSLALLSMMRCFSKDFRVIP